MTGPAVEPATAIAVAVLADPRLTRLARAAHRARGRAYDAALAALVAAIPSGTGTDRERCLGAQTAVWALAVHY